MYKYVLLGILIFLTLGCTKEGSNLYIEGRVYNPVTGEGIPGVTLHMFREKTFSGIPPESKVVAEATTDTEGNYKMSHTGGAWSYYVNINSGTGGYYLLGWANDNVGLEGKFRFQMPKGKNVVADYEMVPKAKLRYEITNVNCQGSSDNFKLFFWGTEVGYHNDYIGAVTLEGDGCYQSDDNSFAEVPMGDRYYKIEITKNGQTNSYFDTITLQENEEYVYIIDY